MLHNRAFPIKGKRLCGAPYLPRVILKPSSTGKFHRAARRGPRLGSDGERQGTPGNRRENMK